MIVKDFEEMERRVLKASAGDVFLISGEEYFQSARLTDKLTARTAQLSFDVHRLDGEDMGEVSLTALFSEGSLFSAGKTVVISNSDRLPKNAAAELEKIVETGIEHVLMCRTSGRKPSSKAFKAMESHAVSFTCWEPFPGQMWKWTGKLAKEEGLKLTKEGSAALEAVASGSLEKLSDCIRRVSLFHLGAETVDGPGVHRAISGTSEADAFGFCQSVLTGRRGDAMTALASLLAAGEEPIRLLALLYSQWKQAASARELLQQGVKPGEACSILGLTPFRWKGLEAIAGKMLKTPPAAVPEAFAAADQSLKTSGDPLLAIGRVVLTLTTGK